MPKSALVSCLFIFCCCFDAFTLENLHTYVSIYIPFFLTLTLSHSLIHFTTFLSNHKVLSSCKSMWEWTFKLLKRELWIMLLPKILLFTLVICYPLASHYLHIRWGEFIAFVRTNCCSRLLASVFFSALHFEKNFNSKSQTLKLVILFSHANLKHTHCLVV